MKTQINRRRFLSFGGAAAASLLGACASSGKRQEYGDTSRMYDVNVQVDKVMMRSGGVDGTDQEMYAFQIEFVSKLTKQPYLFKDEHGNSVSVMKFWETARDAPFVQKMLLSATPAVLTSYLNGRTARSVAEKGCPDGKSCAPVVNSTVNNNLHLPSCGGAACGTATP